MKRIAYYRWLTWNLQGTKKTPTRHHMDEATALARHPDAEKIELSLEWREVPESPEEATELHRRNPGDRR